ncbi:alpha/beta hydrolase [Oceanicola sp. 22II-s10i]|uniref:alpha/beta fold hydrolase n=1 Tax=Oceanicola sp. 22II-s10i TaxID=1317116 RepID=UPI000B521475|nr:alpha/beta fold hydrolase [Oceanicola sp. 22II-s10i]OWU85110.1 alpha/beta hydrolase [Oceanicola sp. 22II-s10i]
MAEPLVLIPGLMCDTRLFADQIAACAPDRTVTVALPTQGERMEEIASNLLDQLPHRFALIGHCIGGGVAMEILRRAPERVQRLALISTSPLADTPQQAADRETVIVKARSGQLEEALKAVMPVDVLAPGPGRLGIQARYVEMGLALGPAAFERQIRALQRRRDQQATLRKIKVPTLLACGTHDQMTPVKRHEFMAELIRGSRFVEMPEAGHLLPIEQPAALTEALRGWLTAPPVPQPVI